MKSLIGERTRIMLMINPHSPTGLLLTESDISMINSILDLYPDLILISDEVYDKFKYIPSPQFNSLK